MSTLPLANIFACKKDKIEAKRYCHNHAHNPHIPKMEKRHKYKMDAQDTLMEQDAQTRVMDAQDTLVQLMQLMNAQARIMHVTVWAHLHMIQTLYPH